MLVVLAAQSAMRSQLPRAPRYRDSWRAYSTCTPQPHHHLAQPLYVASFPFRLTVPYDSARDLLK
jgi:hypothetical protein